MNLESRVKDIHEWVANALEEDLYRRYIGRFEVRDVRTRVWVNRLQPGEEIFNLDGLENYTLHLKLDQEEVPGTESTPDYIEIGYHTNSLPPRLKGTFDITVHYSAPGEKDLVGNLISGAVEQVIVHTTGNVWNMFREGVGFETLDWIYDQLVTYRNPPVEEKAEQLGRLLRHGDKLEGEFAFMSLNPRKPETGLPDLAVPMKGRWSIEHVDRPYRGRRFTLTEKEPLPAEQQDKPCYMLMVNYSKVDKIFDGHEFNPEFAGQENRGITNFGTTENPHILTQALDAFARRVGYNWR